MESLEEVPESVKDLLQMSCGAMEMFDSTQKQIVKRLLRAGFTTARRAAEEYPRSRSNNGADLGIRGRRSASFFLDWGCGQLLWLNCGIPLFGRQRATWPNLQTKKRLAPDSIDRSSQAGAALESAAGRTACQATGTGPSQSGDRASGAKAGGLSAGCGQKRSTLPGSDSTAVKTPTKTKPRKRASLVKAA